MACIICGSGAEYICSIKGIGICLCENHLEGTSFDTRTKIQAA